jgi:hypothetical protein
VLREVAGSIRTRRPLLLVEHDLRVLAGFGSDSANAPLLSIDLNPRVHLEWRPSAELADWSRLDSPVAVAELEQESHRHIGRESRLTPVVELPAS